MRLLSELLLVTEDNGQQFFHASHRPDKVGWELFENGQYNQRKRMIC